MTTGEIIALVAAGGTLGFLWWRRTHPAPASSPGDDVCNSICKDAGQDNDACRAACKLGGAILGAVNPFHDSTQQAHDERERRQGVNDDLNGAPAVPNPFPQSSGFSVLGSTVLRYENGCEPFYGAPGWTKCKSGTLDMYKSAVVQGAGLDPSVYHGGEEDNTTAPAELELGPDQNAPAQTEHVTKAHFLTGASADPTTVGPYRDTSNGSLFWYVRGVKVAGEPGKAPKAVVMQAFNRDAQIAALTDDDARSLVDISQDPLVTHTFTGTCPPPAGFTYYMNTAGQWALKRMAAGDVQNLGPCAPTRLWGAERASEHL